MARFKSRDLDRWASALGVTNDADALRVLSKTLALTLAARADCEDLARVSRSAPDDSACRDAMRAVIAFDLIVELMLPVYRGFQQHSRGR